MTKLLNDPGFSPTLTTPAIPRWFEDFNRAAELPEAEDDAPPEATYTAAELAAARLEAWNDGFVAASRGQAATHANVNDRLYRDMLSQAETLDQKLDIAAERNATLIARWLARNVIAVLPDLSAAVMADRTRRVAAMLRSALRSQTRIELRVGGETVMMCETMQDLCQQIAQRNLTDHPPGDVTIAWEHGEARIDLEQTWHRIRAAILPLADNADQTVNPGQGECLSHVG